MSFITYRSGTVLSRRSADILGKKIILHELTEGDADPRVHPIMEGRHEIFKQRRKQGHCVFGYVKDDTIVAYFWVTEGVKRAPIIFNNDFEVPIDCIYIWGCKTHESHRNRGIFSSGIRSISSMHEEKNILIAANDDNLASKKALKNVGFEKKFLRYGGLRYPIFPPMTWKYYYK